MGTLRSGTGGDTSEKTEQGPNASTVKYEDYRKRRIQENMQRMQEMGITNISIGAPARKSPRRTPTKASNLSSGSQSSFPIRRSLRLQNISPVNYSEHPNEKKSMGENVLIDEGLVPEVYTEEHEKLLGSCQNAWVLFQDGYGRDGKRIYDPLNGKTCHQCRQKTLGHRTSCSKCNLVQGQFCGDCLYMRYGEHVLEAKRTPGWICPVCRGICNCSLCRIKKGWLPTGTLYKKITRLGYKSVAHYLIQTHRFDAKNEGNHETIDGSTSEGPLNFSDADQADIENKLSSAIFESCQDPEEPSYLEAKDQMDSPAVTTGLSNEQHEASMTAIPVTDHGSEKKYPSDLIQSLDNNPHQNAIVESLQSGLEIGIVDCDLNSSTKVYTKEGEVNVLDAFSPTTPENFSKHKNRNKNYSERTTMISDSIAGRIKRRYAVAHPSNSKNEMENLVLDDPLQTVSLHSYSDYKSVMASVSDSHHPLSPASDPLFSPYEGSSPKGAKDLVDTSFLVPPSHAEAVFSPFGHEQDVSENGHDSGSGNSSGRLDYSLPYSAESGPSAAEYLRIMVTDPQKEQEMTNSLVPGGSTYVTYLITTKTNMSAYSGSSFVVRRRFRDVVTLSDRLAESYRGFFIPPRPDKNVVESQVMQQQEFVEQRRVSLEKYLRKLAAHPVIKRSEELRLFLQVHGKLPLSSTTDVASRMLDGAVRLPRQLFGESASTISPQDVAQPAKGGRDLLRIFKELKQSVANDWGGSKPQVVEEDKEFMEKKEKVLHLEQQLSNASQQAEGLVKAQQDIGETMGELGLAFIKLATFETDVAVFNTQRVRVADTRRVATAAVKASRFYRESNAQAVKHLDKLHEYLGLMQAVHSAFSDRSNALLTVQTLSSELSSMSSRAEKLEAASSKIFGGDKTRHHKLEELRDAIKVTEDAKNCAVKEYERIKENNRSELERFGKERTSDFFGMLRGLVISQVAYTEKIAGVWTQVVEETSGYAKESS